MAKPSLALFMTGPVRPTPTLVLEHLKKIKGQFEETFEVYTFFLTWKHLGSKTILADGEDLIDYFLQVKEPKEDFVVEAFGANPDYGSQRQRAVVNVFKQHYGMNAIIRFAKSLNIPFDFGCRIRTDIEFTINDSVSDFTLIDDTVYKVPGMYDDRVNDFFGFARFDTFSNVWCFDNVQDFGIQFRGVGWDPHGVIAQNMNRIGTAKKIMECSYTLKNLGWMKDNMPECYTEAIEHWENG